MESKTLRASFCLVLLCFHVLEVSGFEYIGCFKVQTQVKAKYTNSEMTKEVCLHTCVESHPGLFRYIGLQYGTDCMCTSDLSVDGMQSANEADCNKLCPGNLDETCGGIYMRSVYRIGNNVTGNASCTPCTDSCIKSEVIYNWSDPDFVEEINQRLAALRAYLIVDKRNLSSHKNSKMSAADPRLSVTMTGTVGVIVLVLVASVIVIFDMMTVCKTVSKKNE